MSEVAIYEAENGEIQVKLEKNTVWLRQEQMADLFGRERSVITRHIGNIFKEDELVEKSNVQNMHIANSDKPVKSYSLDVIISVGYRVKSRNGTRFRQWATRLLNEHLVKGYTLSQQRFEENATELEAALRLIGKAAQSPELATESGRGLVEIVSRYTQTFLWLQRYDEGLLIEPKGRAGGVLPTETEARLALAELKTNLMQRGEATELFATERSDGLSSILGNLDQTVFGEPAYPSIESKAAHLYVLFCKKPPLHRWQQTEWRFSFCGFPA